MPRPLPNRELRLEDLSKTKPQTDQTESLGLESRLWLEVLDQLQQMCKSIVSSNEFHVAVLQSQERLSSKMRDFTLSLGDRMQNLSINMKSQTAGIARRVEALTESVDSLPQPSTSHFWGPKATAPKSNPRGPVGAAPPYARRSA